MPDDNSADARSLVPGARSPAGPAGTHRRLPVSQRRSGGVSPADPRFARLAVKHLSAPGLEAFRSIRRPRSDSGTKGPIGSFCSYLTGSSRSFEVIWLAVSDTLNGARWVFSIVGGI